MNNVLLMLSDNEGLRVPERIQFKVAVTVYLIFFFFFDVL
jgi:hypothetical protein